ncbi:Putative carboxymethylenebutenolidase [Halomicronema hongdechloris C2206]|uniref:Carboxymethylenebutenolidase n=1 Tax=Halomicronema hongdechloris C2206 TaxID=1641165 RepID=A0A1Z3HH28_9CYAN|nr:dienelactone hydrolase family protein [Halomicronema hongdechloris]ASC69632.1 Putative carboxymethylenebutenolidase [Halomicronema hongdechloris C2206]
MRSHPWFAPLFGIALAVILVVTACSADAPTPDTSLDSMAQEHTGDQPVATELATQPPRQPVTSRDVTYASVEGEAITGFLTQPDTPVEEPRPGIIAIHEWWGLNENIKTTAQRLAGEGYTVLAIDLYNGAVTDTPDQARQLVQAVRDNPDQAQANLQQAYDYLVNEQQAAKVGTIGWCFGGTWSLQTALLLPQAIDATVIYYGQLVTDASRLEPLQMPILGIFGAEDRSIPLEQVRAFESTLTDLDKSVDVHVYEGAGHAFANPSGQRYVPEAAAAAWQETLDFFRQTLL